MSGIVAALVGGAAVGAISTRNSTNKAIKAQDRASEAAAANTAEAAALARNDASRLFGGSTLDRQVGAQNALNVFRDVVPQQAQQFQQGNLNAQNTILAGLPQIQNAILGGNLDLSGLQASQQMRPDFEFLNQRVTPSNMAETRDFITQQQVDASNAALNSGLGAFDSTNPAFLGQMGPFQTGQLGPFDMSAAPVSSQTTKGSWGGELKRSLFTTMLGMR